MIGQQGPSIDWGLRLCGKITQPDDKVLPDLVVIHDPALFNPPEHHVVKGSWSIQSRLARHKNSFRVSAFGITTPLS
jgi:hypothetical protein